MDQLTFPILITIAVIGSIAITIVKLFYKDKKDSYLSNELDKNTSNLSDELNNNVSDSSDKLNKNDLDLSDELHPIFSNHWQESFGGNSRENDNKNELHDRSNSDEFVSNSLEELMEGHPEQDVEVENKIFEEPMNQNHRQIIIGNDEKYNENENYAESYVDDQSYNGDENIINGNNNELNNNSPNSYSKADTKYSSNAIILKNNSDSKITKKHDFNKINPLKFEHRFFSNFSKYRFLLTELVKRDIKIKYRMSALGILWSFLNPLLMMIVLTFVFSTFFQRDIPNFPVYVLTGRLIFDFFAGSTTAAMVSIRSNASIMKKVYVPKYIYSISAILSNFVNFLISLIVLILVMFVTGAPFSILNLAALIPMVPLFILTIGIGLMLATFTVFFRDVEYLYGVFTTLLMYGCAIFYPVSIIPAQYLPIFLANPVFSAISGFRDSIMYGQFPAIDSLIYLTIFAIVSLILGIIIFYKYQDKFILNV